MLLYAEDLAHLMNFCSVQGWIKNFPVAGGAYRFGEGGAPTYDVAKFSEKMHGIDNISAQCSLMFSFSVFLLSFKILFDFSINDCLQVHRIHWIVTKLKNAGWLLGMLYSGGSRISPRRRCQLSWGVRAPTYDFVKFSWKLHEIERLWTPRKWRASLPPP